MIERLLHFIERFPLDLISHLSSGLPIIAGFFNFSFLGKELRLVWYLFIFLFLKDTYALINMFLTPSIHYIQNLEVIIETIIVGFIFFYSFNKTIHQKLLVVFTIIGVVLTIIFYKTSEVSSASLSTFRSFSIILSLSYFNKILTDMRIKSITKHSMFWFTAGLLIYSTGTFFIFLFSEYIYDPKKTSIQEFDKYWNISQVLFIIFSILSTCGLWVSRYDKENTI